ncbi:hypothetical protein QNI16_31040 [Cytophagaceae bacterium YF14B1]|uniref:Uncharacterized protein n=1 Tax=Xanthocytophaga flava TaxID=3048013 RepID=A0AAE3QT59_9BACT|nr:hypothetical protein [Xanthocytophaga flavus]MDJ1484977.1 hypothetical protein [Xanthocytophaga flavus]
MTILPVAFGFDWNYGQIEEISEYQSLFRNIRTLFTLQHDRNSVHSCLRLEYQSKRGMTGIRIVA